MPKELTHTGRKSWWNGQVKTLCGLVLERPEWVLARTTCPTCKRLKREGHRP